MRMFYDLYATDRFLDQLQRLGRVAQKHVVNKLWGVLPLDPRDNGDTKKLLHGNRRRVKSYRLRSGKYRVLYTFDSREGWVTLHAVDDRGDLEGEGYSQFIAGVTEGRGSLVPPEPTNGRPVVSSNLQESLAVRSMPTRQTARNPSVELPRRIDASMVERLAIPAMFRTRLLSCKTDDDLVAAALPAEIHDRIIDALLADDPIVLPQQLRWHVQDEGTLLAWLRGDLTTLLLDLDPEQRAHVEWSASNRGPTLLKGGPGSGKSVVAAYRARNLVAQLRRVGVAQPSVLLTTYTNALANTLLRLVNRLLGPDASCVEVLTSDQLVKRILTAGSQEYRPKNQDVARAACYFGMQKLKTGSDDDRAHAARLERFGLDYLREEIERVIVGRNLQSLDDYRGASRAGRKVGFTGPIRVAVWRLAEEVEQYHEGRRQSTFAQTRRSALRLLLGGNVALSYDGVIIDKAQDLDPNLLELAVQLCPSLDRLFVTADSDQSIYGGSFRWSEVSKALRFTGRTGRLENCYRSTAEIAAAARAWLAEAGIDPPDEVSYRRRGALPIAHVTPDMPSAIDAVVDFLRAAMSDLRVGAGSCGVLAPTNADGPSIARALDQRGIPAKYMPSSSFDIGAPGVKVTTFHAAKGLEFPVVAVVDRPLIPVTSRDSEEGRQERQEEAERERRVRFVAMTRALHALAYIRADPSGLEPEALRTSHWRSSADGWGGWLEAEVAASG